MRLHVADHPLVAHKLTVLRDVSTPVAHVPAPGRRAGHAPGLRGDAGRAHARRSTSSRRSRATTGTKLADPRPIVVPILRAGLGMLDGMTRVLPTAEVGFLGMQRDEETLEAITYANRLPDDLSGRQCFLLDPMLATGGTLVAAIDYLLQRGARDVTAVCLLAAPEGLAVVEEFVGDRADVSRWSSRPSTSG